MRESEREGKGVGERNIRVMESECKGVEVGGCAGVGVWLVNTVCD